jgi:hypothetical protein
MVIAAACADHAPPRAQAVPAVAAPAPAPAATPAPMVAEVAAPAPDLFQAEVKPLLMRKCSPCHAPGGRMYDRMPFDAPATIVDHQAGVLRRIKDPEEHALIERWLETRH